jgi:hypothetical protein
MYISFKKSIIAIFFIPIFIGGCKNAVPDSEKKIHSVIPVTVAHSRPGEMVNYMELNATSSYLFKSAVKAPVTGFVDAILINQGDPAEKNQLLFKLKTREAAALAGDSINNLKFRGVVDVKASAAGIVSSVEHTSGDYVSEGDQLCQIAIPGSFVFILDVPFELSGAVKLNTTCDIVLPDSEIVKGIIKSRLPSMTASSQTERYIVRLSTPIRLPENLTGKIKIVKKSVKDALSLPKSSILTNETMESFWVMKLINDSVAVRIPVTTGISTEDYIQIVKPELKPSDLFLTSGNYGLGDTVYVKVLKITDNGQ